MTNEELEALGAFPSQFSFHSERVGHRHDITVQWRGLGLWAIVDGASNYNRDGQWEYERQPSSRDEAFFKRCRYTLDEALRIASRIGR